MSIRVSGPGLKSVDSHAAIHEAALNEAKELNHILGRLLKDNQKEKALETAYIAVEHWETRTLRHAEAEENGLYKEMIEENPDLKDEIVALTRDHDTMRYLVKEIKHSLEMDGFDEEVLQQFHALVHVDMYHNLEEERILPHH
ncbi:Hemerythrin HHE cation binding domain-containing protein [Oceanobacillus limi]|uniref:Hemerythrin HHE cation binding domain-containing protein n=1 Tax=Oceanobacillus limi TaxID=930131 RepID=A0A1I0CCI3_9BACI|nr:hemerythrin domain-containing protein [Oceanobacillus limi]SET17270.1 Hemerythrin HHE cation binding domain-containing protein [Oceanobacillus limi]